MKNLKQELRELRNKILGEKGNVIKTKEYECIKKFSYQDILLIINKGE